MGSIEKMINSRDRCAFHDDLGHKTKNCFTLRDVIEEVVQNRELVEFVIKVVHNKVRTRVAIQTMLLKEQTLSRANPLYDFANHPIDVRRSITLPITLGDGKHTTMKHVQFHMVDHAMAYNAIFRKKIMRMEKMLVAMFCMKIKFLTKTWLDSFNQISEL
ncbi:hypothetical protein PVK06_047649 [Gossypium arboreum]|uniref:Uncharacterized protein n=1 Tax=Gossypium arboreum TaxID=29729 RepID=A0ABR0MDW1_GOSAR|nr:hypothetical protein PVK06_047649 [Gossypium arboreum]